MLSAVGDFFNNAKDKVTNPFFGTLIFVWLVRNWELAYTLFNFDSDCNLADKKQFINDYYSDKHIGWELFHNIWITFVLMLLGYALLLASRFIANFIEHNATPKLNKIAASNLVANRAVLNEVEEMLQKKSEELIKERRNSNEVESKIVGLRGELDRSELKFKELQTTHVLLENNYKTSQDANYSFNKLDAENQSRISKLQDELKYAKGIQDNITREWESKFRLFDLHGVHPTVYDAYDSLTMELREKFLMYSLEFQIKDFADIPDDLAKQLIEKKLLVHTRQYNRDVYALTPLGERVIEYHPILQNEIPLF